MQCGELRNEKRVENGEGLRCDVYGHCFVWLAFGTVAEERCYGGEGIEKEAAEEERVVFYQRYARERDDARLEWK